MSDKKMVEQLIADSRLAFLNQQNDVAFSLANRAIKLQNSNAEAYKCAGNAMMSLERYDEAIKYYSLAVKYDASNGNRYYDLGFALATNDRLADAIKNLAKADELGCIPENAIQMYNLLGIICFDIGRYDDALINLSKAEQLVGANLDILQRKAIIYGIKNDIRNGLNVANQIKLIAPSEYLGYKLAFKLLVQSKRLDKAKTELQKAAKYAVPTMDFYFDQMTYELERYKLDNNKEHFNKSLEIIDTALKTIKPEYTGVVESYINAAEIYLQLENADKTIQCLNAALSPALAYNNGFAIIDPILIPPAEIDEYAVEMMMEEDKARIEALGEYGFEELVENAVPDEEGGLQFLTEIEEEPEEVKTSFKLDETEEYEMELNHSDQINRLFIGAYTIKKEFEKVIEYAKILQGRDGIENTYLGRYTEVNALKEMGAENAEAKYESAIKFFRNAMLKDPTDIMAVTFRIQCYIDIKKYDEAVEVCNLLANEVKETFLDKIRKAKSGE